MRASRHAECSNAWMMVFDLKMLLILKMCAAAWHDVDKIAKCIVERNVTIWKIYVFIGFCSGTIHLCSFPEIFFLELICMGWSRWVKLKRCVWVAIGSILSALHVLPVEWWLKQFTAQLVASCTATTKRWLIRTVCRTNLLLRPVVVLCMCFVLSYILS